MISLPVNWQNEVPVVIIPARIMAKIGYVFVFMTLVFISNLRHGKVPVHVFGGDGNNMLEAEKGPGVNGRIWGELQNLEWMAIYCSPAFKRCRAQAYRLRRPSSLTRRSFP
jgi:hypothetical protein